MKSINGCFQFETLVSELAPPLHDGTLVETMTKFYEADRLACEEVGIAFSKKRFYALAGVPIKEIFRILAEEQGKTPDLDAMCDRWGAEEVQARPWLKNVKAPPRLQSSIVKRTQQLLST